jgi:hypothetical protein
MGEFCSLKMNAFAGAIVRGIWLNGNHLSEIAPLREQAVGCEPFASCVFCISKNRQSYLGKVTPRNTIFTIGHF